MLHSLTRYLLVAVLAAAVALSQVWNGWPLVVRVTASTALLLAAIAGAAIATGSDGFAAVRDYTADQRSLLALAHGAPAGTVFVGPYAGNALPGHHVLYPERVADPVARKRVTQDETYNLLTQGIPVMGNQTRAGAYAQWIDQDPRMAVRTVLPGFWEAYLG
jgi:hypothetical protein